VIYPSDDLTPAERDRLAPHFSDLDGPVFALVDLPETVKGALFARYSRYPGTLRRLFLEEFADARLTARVGGSSRPEGSDSRPSPGSANSRADSRPSPGSASSRADSRPSPGSDRAAELYETIFVGYGDDSVAQLGGAHIACEWVSNVLTKVLQRPRLASYLEQSTRYISYASELPGGGYRYYRDAALGPEYEAAMDALFGAYAEALPRVTAWVDQTFPANPAESEAARRRAVKAKALDLLRGLLPAASLSHMGIYASGQAYEQLILHLLAHPLPEARAYGQMLLEAVKAVMPSFVSRVERPGRGDVWMGHLAERRDAERRWVARLGLDRDHEAEQRPSVRLVGADGDEARLLAALLFEAAGVPEERAIASVEALAPDQRERMLADLVGERANRRHRPGRGFEALRYRFEIVSDYGAFRDLQRHRMLTVQWQALTPDLGADVPEEVAAAGCGDLYAAALERSRAEYERLWEAGLTDAAPYALCLGYRIRYVLDLNAREAMHLIELRSAREGHATYRAVAQAMHALIRERDPAVAGAMKHVDLSTETRLERILSEIRGESRLART
jgi:thymidylate synthase ThyX